MTLEAVPNGGGWLYQAAVCTTSAWCGQRRAIRLSLRSPRLLVSGFCNGRTLCHHGSFCKRKMGGTGCTTHTFSPLRHSGDILLAAVVRWGKASVTQIGASEMVKMVGRGRVCKVTGESKVSSVSQCWNTVWCGMVFGRAVHLGVSTC